VLPRHSKSHRFAHSAESRQWFGLQYISIDFPAHDTKGLFETSPKAGFRQVTPYVG
jgi:hypothetical protein